VFLSMITGSSFCSLFFEKAFEPTMSSIRQARVAEMIRRELSEIFLRSTRDPRLAMVTVTNVEVARDFTFAKVFISSLGDAAEKAACLKAVQGASGYLRGQLGKVLELRVVPVLAFRYDTGIESGARMFELLRSEETQYGVNHANDDRPADADLPVMTEDDFAVASDPAGVE
jgi:ribosome-binding factor A